LGVQDARMADGIFCGCAANLTHAMGILDAQNSTHLIVNVATVNNSNLCLSLFYIIL
jgi:hypothetical protein